MNKRFRLRPALVLCKRNLIKLTRTPEQLIDVTLQPIIFLVLFLFVLGGAIAHGSPHDYLELLLLCVILVGFGYALGFRITTSPMLLLAALGLSICFALAFAWVSLCVGMTVRTAGAV